MNNINQTHINELTNLNLIGIGGGRCTSLRWNNDEVFEAKIIIIVTGHNNESTIKRAIISSLNQKCNIKFSILLLDDSSTDNWRHSLGKILLDDKLLIANGISGKAWKARNLVHKIIQKHFLEYEWICRLDADDEFASNHVLSDIYTSINREKKQHYWALSGNKLRLNGEIIKRENYPNQELKNTEYLLSRLQKMKKGEDDAELPSCNLWIHRDLRCNYPELESAEDHWLLALILIRYPNEGIIFPNLLHAIYSLSGNITAKNRKEGSYHKSRNLLFHSAFFWVNSIPLDQGTSCVLGWGGEGTVWLENNIIKKKFYIKTIKDEQIHWLEKKIKGNHIIHPKWQKTNKRWEAHYPYFKTEKCTNVTLPMISNFVQFSLLHQIACINITHKNYRIHKGELLFIDVGNHILPFEIRFFRDICARLYLLFVKNLTDIELNQITLKIRNNIKELKKIDGFEDFFKREVQLFFMNQGFLSKPFRNILKPYRYHPEITLMIKCCALEHNRIISLINHIHNQICVYDRFFETILLIDSKDVGFSRQYGTPSLDKVIQSAKNLEKQKKIDKYLITPISSNIEIINDINKRWFGIDCIFTHTDKEIPVFPQLWGFEQVKTHYVFQMDIDSIICHQDINYDVFGKMLNALKDDQVFSVGFNIPQEEGTIYKVYDAPMGQYVPEVRCGLLDLERIKSNRPFPNHLVNDKLVLSWYRSIEQFQKFHNWRSLRGGHPLVYYIHPPNTYKNDINFWDRVIYLVEENHIPDIQRLKWDLTGNKLDWKYSIRNEDHVIIVFCYKSTVHWARSCLKSLFNQNYQNWGAIIFNFNDDLDFNLWLKKEITQKAQKITLIQETRDKNSNHQILGRINEICLNPNTIYIGMNINESFFNNSVLTQISDISSQKTKLLLLGTYFNRDPLIGHAFSESDLENFDLFITLLKLKMIRCGKKKYLELILNSITNRTNLENQEYNKNEIYLLPEYHFFISYYTNFEDKEMNKKKLHPSLYIPNLKRIEIDITYKCNLRCPGCSRSCAQAPSEIHISLETIKNFLKITEERKIQWESVHILGGEPTLHPQFLEIIRLLTNWFEEHSPATDLKVISNGFGTKVNEMLNKIPSRWKYNNSFKIKSKNEYFEPFNLAPVDLDEWKNEDFRKGCWITQDSGIGLTPFGYFQCAIAGGIERIMKFGGDFSKLPSHPWEFLESMDKYCRYCGVFLNDKFHSRDEQLHLKIDPNTKSKSWLDAYEKWKEYKSTNI